MLKANTIVHHFVKFAFHSYRNQSLYSVYVFFFTIFYAPIHDRMPSVHTTNWCELNAVNNSRKTRKNYHRRRPQSTDDLFTLLWLFVLRQTTNHSRYAYRTDATSRCCRYNSMGDGATATASVVSPNRKRIRFYFCALCMVFLFSVCAVRARACHFLSKSSIGGTESDCVSVFTRGAARQTCHALHCNAHSSYNRIHM